MEECQWTSCVLQASLEKSGFRKLSAVRVADLGWRTLTRRVKANRTDHASGSNNDSHAVHYNIGYPVSTFNYILCTVLAINKKAIILNME